MMNEKRLKKDLDKDLNDFNNIIKLSTKAVASRLEPLLVEKPSIDDSDINVVEVLHRSIIICVISIVLKNVYSTTESTITW